MWSVVLHKQDFDMADALKEHKLKLANSRKRFKELQEEKRKKEAAQKTDQSTEYKELDSNTQTHVESMNTSTHSSLNNDVPSEIISNNGNDSAPLTNYFADANYGDNFIFFDNISKPQHNMANEYCSKINPSSYEIMQNATSLGNMISSIVDCSKPVGNQADQRSGNYSLFPKENVHNYVMETQHILHPHQDTPDYNDTYSQPSSNMEQSDSYYSSNHNIQSLDYPEIKQNEIFEIHNNYSNHNILSSENNQNTDCFENVGNDLNAENNSTIETDLDNSEAVQEEIKHSSIESLRQLSNHMAQIIVPEYTALSSITDLEKRNLELAALLEQERLSNEQQKVQIEELKLKINTLETDGERKQENLMLQSTNEISRLREELQCHIQTVGLLVAEKTELSASLSQLELTAKQKVSECEELQARLKASRSRAFEIEQELIILRNDKNKKETNGIEQRGNIDELKQEVADLRDQKEELLQDVLEAREKLKNSSLDNLNLQKQIQEVSSKLSLAEIRIQQISSGEQQQLESQVENLTQEKFELVKHLESVNLMLKTMTKERDESTSHYQQYTQELNAQMTNLSNQIQRLQQENELLSIREQNRIKHISDLERQLQSLQNDQVAFATNRTNGDHNLKNELKSVRELCVQLQIEKTTAEENYTHATNEKEMLLKELAAKNDSLGQLESMIEQLRGNQPDSVKLLATMESDKVAAARAVQQNKELKEQMEGMKEVVAKLDNDKVQLTEKVNFEQSSNKELFDKLRKTELQLQRLTDAIEIKDRELSHLREHSTELNKQVLQQEQLADRLRHYEAHDNSSQALQNELQESKQVVMKLSNELNMLRKYRSTGEIAGDVSDINGSEIIDLKRQLEAMEIKNDELQLKLANHSVIHNNINEIDGNIDTRTVLKCLEEKVKHTMQDIADLTEEKQRLEHLVLQLQGETETIGEYVALYQHQRMVLKQKALEKDQQFKQLASDREEMKRKLEKLNALVKTMVAKNGFVPNELLKEHDSLVGHSDNFCEEHSNIHKEIEKISDGNCNEADVGNSSEAAEEILALLTEIKTSNLVQPTENFHHCPWCSGQLITV